MKHLRKNGQDKFVPTGFSWTTLFFGIFPALFRGDLKWAIIMIISAFLSCGISWLVFPFFYNARYLEDLLTNGWEEVK